MFWKEYRIKDLEERADNRERALMLLENKFKELEAMCLTTISQLQNVQLAHAERLRKLEQGEPIAPAEPMHIAPSDSNDWNIRELDKDISKLQRWARKTDDRLDALEGKKEKLSKKNTLVVEIPKEIA